MLPDTTRNFEQFQWLAAEIAELGGEAAFWSAQPALEGQDEAIIRQFALQADQAYQELLDALRKPGADLEAIASGFSLRYPNDEENMAAQFEVYDALYAWCRLQAAKGV